MCIAQTGWGQLYADVLLAPLPDCLDQGLGQAHWYLGVILCMDHQHWTGNMAQVLILSVLTGNKFLRISGSLFTCIPCL